MTGAHSLDLAAPDVPALHHSDEAEQAVIGALLQDNSSAAAVKAVLSVSDFYTAEHQHFYAAIMALIDAGVPADEVTVFEHLQRRGQADAHGGLPYITALAQSGAPSAENVLRYAEVVRNRATVRHAAAQAQALVAQLRQPGDHMALLQDAGRRLQELSTKEPGGCADPLQALAHWFVTDEQVDKMQATRMIWRRIVALSHLIVWAAPGNGGKTTLAKTAAAEIAAAGYLVLFFQEDASAGDLPAMHEHAKAHGYKLLNSTLAGSQPEDQIKVLRGLARDGADLGQFVMFFDTLKKYADLMSKGGSREFFQLMRALTQRGATVILLGHTNKHRGVDGKLIFEGVGDVRNDVDEMFYIDATDRDPQGLVTLTIRPDKVRCAVAEATFELDTNTMQVRALAQVVDVAAIRAAQERRQADAPLVAVINAELSAGGLNYTELLERAVRAADKPRSRVREVLDRYCSQDKDAPGVLWTETRLRTNNVRYIAINPGANT